MTDAKDNQTSLKGKKQRRVFARYEHFKLAKLGLKWRRPRGLHSKVRQGRKGKPPQVNVGYGRPVAERGMLNGYVPIVVQNIADLGKIDTKRGQAAILASGLGLRKVAEISKKAKQLGIVILNKEKIATANARAWMINKQREERAKAKTEAKTETRADTKEIVELKKVEAKPAQTKMPAEESTKAERADKKGE